MKTAKIRPARRCASCGQRLPSGKPPRPLSLDTRFKRGISSIVRTVKLIEDQRGKTAARLARAKLNEALKGY